MRAGRSMARRLIRAVVACTSVLRVLVVLAWFVWHWLHLVIIDHVAAHAPHVGHCDQVARVVQNMVIATSVVVSVYAPGLVVLRSGCTERGQHEGGAQHRPPLPADLMLCYVAPTPIVAKHNVYFSHLNP